MCDNQEENKCVIHREKKGTPNEINGNGSLLVNRKKKQKRIKKHEKKYEFFVFDKKQKKKKIV